MSELEGISILIPVYNHDVRHLVKTLLEQGRLLKNPFEIRCYDDHSDQETKIVNRDLQHLPNIVSLELDKNLGRSKIRNKLASEAQYQNLIFLDCDSLIPNQNFLSNYSQYLSQDVVVGGRQYTEVPESENYVLHWKVGKAKEESYAVDRSKAPHNSFMSNNFLIKKSIFNKIRMDESLTGYGHEDSKFGYDLKKHQVIITHIDNPVIHEQLDNKEAFLSKTKEGIKNFKKLIQQGLGHDTKLFKTYHFLKRYKLTGVYKICYSFIEKKIERNLLSSSPSLIYFDAYKLYHLINDSSN